ncbi:hypothetical protein BASA62_003177 [Batrachochytrium salamandrivorans]|nr:hypothetical protein BASA62_003177 [Batrachochytrium salamandrivorans]
MSVVLPNTPVGLLALALEALDDISLSVFRDRYAESSTVFCGTAVDLGDMFHLVAQDWSENPQGNPWWYCATMWIGTAWYTTCRKVS